MNARVCRCGEGCSLRAARRCATLGRVVPLLWVALVVIAGWSATFRVREIELALRTDETKLIERGPFRSSLVERGEARLAARARWTLWLGCAALSFVGASALWLLVAHAHEFNRAPEVHGYLDGALRTRAVAAARTSATVRAALDAAVLVACVLAHRRFVSRLLATRGAVVASR